jgi:transposase-like protein
MEKKRFSVVPPAVLPVAERSEAERSEAQRSGETGKTGAAWDVPPRLDAEVPSKAKRRSFPAEYKKRILAEADAATEPGSIGALLRREGLYSSHLTTWRQERAASIDQAFSKKRGPKVRRSAMAEENAKLRRQNERLTEELRKAQLIIDVQKKVAALLGRTMPDIEPEGL